MNMPACTLFNKQNKGPSLQSIITCSVLGKQNVQAKKVYNLQIIDIHTINILQLYKVTLSGELKALNTVL